MSKPFVPKAGTTAECAAFTGLENEVVLDEEKGSLIVHDGITVGGAHEILPKAKNDEIYAPKDLDVGVTSFNGSKGAVTYSAPVSSVNGQTGTVTVDVGVTSVNGKTGNVTLAVSDGTVSAKVSTSLTIIGRTAKTYTVTGLTANKPVFIGVKRTDTVSGYVYFWVSSGTGVETSTNNNTLYGQEDNIAIDNERAYWFPVVPTGTSIVFSHYIASDKTATLSLVVYQ